MCAVPSSILAGKFYSNILSTYYLLPGCRFEGLLIRNLSGCPILMIWIYEAWCMWIYCSNHFHNKVHFNWIFDSIIRASESSIHLPLQPSHRLCHLTLANSVHHHQGSKTIATKTACLGPRSRWSQGPLLGCDAWPGPTGGWWGGYRYGPVHTAINQV